MSYEVWGDNDDSPFDAAIEAGWVDPASLSRAWMDVRAERDRQVSKGYTQEHDDLHRAGELARAAAAHALSGSVRRIYDLDRASSLWPFEPETFKVQSERESLIIAAAFLIAEIERRDRAEACEVGR